MDVGKVLTNKVKNEAEQQKVEGSESISVVERKVYGDKNFITANARSTTKLTKQRSKSQL